MCDVRLAHLTYSKTKENSSPNFFARSDFKSCSRNRDCLHLLSHCSGRSSLMLKDRARLARPAHVRAPGREWLCVRKSGKRLVAKVPDVPRLLDRMEGMQLLRRERDAADRRH